MNRRNLLKLAGFGLGSLALPAFAEPAWVVNPYVVSFGTRPPHRRQRQRQRRFYSTFSPFRGVSDAVKRDVLLYRNLERELGEIVPHDQNDRFDNGRLIESGEGDCIGHATAMCCDVLAATNVHMLGLQEAWKAKASVEMIYAGSRIEIGQASNSRGRNVFQGRGGSFSDWAAKFVNRFGVLHRLCYAVNENRIDLSGYNPERSRTYRDVGVPDWLEPIARNHPVQEFTNVRTAREALDAVCAGQPVLMACSYAFHDTRDADGFAQPYLKKGWVRSQNRYGRWIRKWDRETQWWHAWALTGALLGKRKGGILQNSHGDWNTGPRPYDMPRGAIAVDLDVLDLMVRDWGECYALSSYKGYSAERIRHKLYWG